VQKTVSSVERTFQRIEDSIVRLSDFATRVEIRPKNERWNAWTVCTPPRNLNVYSEC
jgi:hypothetical protein